MSAGFVGLFFFVPPARWPRAGPDADAELLRALGGDLVAGRFSQLGIAARAVEPLSDHLCVQLYFLKAEWIAALADAPEQEPPLERDPLLPFAHAIRDAAVRVDAEAAILDTHELTLEKIVDRYWMVLARDATALAMEWFGFTYMDDDMVADWDPGPALLDRDELPGGPGRTLFGGRRGARWF